MGAHFQPAPPAAISRVLATFSRKDLAGFIAVAIDLLDLAEGDQDVESNGDELDGNAAEDDFWPHSPWFGGAGCEVSDPGGGNVTDEPHDADSEDGI